MSQQGDISDTRSGGSSPPPSDGEWSRSYREVFDAANDALFVHDESGRVLDVNARMCAMFKCERNVALESSPNALSLGESPYSEVEAREKIAIALEKGSETFDWRSRRYDGTLFWSVVSLHSVTIRGARRVIASVRDITLQKEAEEALRLSEERFRALSSLAREGIVVHASGVILDANQAFLDLAGFADRSELIGRYGMDAIPFTPESRQRVLEMQQSEAPSPCDIELVRPDGTRIYAETVSRATTFLDRPVRLVFMRDITERKRSEQALRESEERFRHLFDVGADSTFVIDESGRLLDVNRAACETLGYSRGELLGMTVADVAPGVSAINLPAVFREVREHGKVNIEGFHRRRDGTRFPVDVRITHFLTDESPRYFAAARDVTERKRNDEERARLEESLRHAQRLESMGRLAGGVAHDFNNFLTAIRGNVSLALIDIQSGDPLRDLLVDVDNAAESAAKLTRQLLAFSRKQVIDPKVVNLNELVLQLQRMLMRVIGEDIELDIKLAPDLASVRMDPGQLEQILVNLAVNARDAMPDGGTLTIETCNVHVSNAVFGPQGGVASGPYVRLAVSDEGTGMTEEVRAHLFEPFFTTKEKGRGTGLGLPMVYGAVHQNRGRVEVESEVGKGTAFKIFLPAVAEAAERVSTAPRFEIPRGTETILLVEDDASVRAVAVRLLRRQGYKVLAHANGSDALAALGAATANQARPVPVHLLVTDVVMPGMNGRALADKVRVLLPELKVLFTSGYPEDAVAHHGVIEKGIEFLSKPYTLGGLAKRVREVLDGPLAQND